jgi:hypothetical protein
LIHFTKVEGGEDRGLMDTLYDGKIERFEMAQTVLLSCPSNADLASKLCVEIIRGVPF